MCETNQSYYIAHIPVLLYCTHISPTIVHTNQSYYIARKSVLQCIQISPTILHTNQSYYIARKSVLLYCTQISPTIVHTNQSYYITHKSVLLYCIHQENKLLEIKYVNSCTYRSNEIMFLSMIEYTYITSIIFMDTIYFVMKC